MNIHEYQSKDLLRTYGIDVPKGYVAYTVSEAVKRARELDSDLMIVKAQIHAGGRGKAGGIKFAKTTEQVSVFANELLGKTLITKQTGNKGTIIKRLLIEEGCTIEQEYYISFVIDRDTSSILLIASDEGGTEIEQVSKLNPQKIIKESIDPLIGLQPYQARRVAYAINLPEKFVGKTVRLLQQLYRLFIEKDCSLLEINPLVATKDDRLVVLDAKLNFDANALYRQKDIIAFRDMDEEDEKELKASKYGLSYISLEGNIGCMVNGAGLAMATMDIIKHFHGQPANFLDVGGGATVEKVTEAFKLMISDKSIKGIFINIFGGIMKCDVIAEGIVSAAKQVNIEVPLVVRLEGTNVSVGKKILSESNLDIIVVRTMEEGAQKVVSLAK